MSNFIKKLFCTHKRKRVILWYTMVPSDWYNYAIQTYRTEICANCGRIKTKSTGKYEETFRDEFNYKKMLLESQGYITENDYVYKLDQVIEELGFAEK